MTIFRQMMDKKKAFSSECQGDLTREEGLERRKLTPSVKDLLLLERVRSKMINHGKS